MKNNNGLIVVLLGAASLTFSCGPKEPQAVVQQPQTATPVAAVAPEPEPVRESAWRPAPVRSSTPKRNQPQVIREPPAVAQPERAAPVAAVREEPAPPPVETKTPVRPAPAVQRVTLAAGTIVPVRVGESLSSEKNEAGDAWSGTLAEPLVINGLVIADRGAQVDGRVTDVKRAGKVKGVAHINVELTQLQTADGQRIPIQTASFSLLGKDDTKRDAGKVAIASGIGAAIGAIAGRGKGAAIGAGAGAAAGTGAVLVSRGGPAQIATETLISFRIDEPVTITEKLR